MKMKLEIDMQKKKLLKDGEFTNTKEVLNRVARDIPETKVFAELDDKNNLVYHTVLDVFNDVENIGDGLLDLGLKNKHIAIAADNSYLYVMCDIAVSCGVGVITPIDKDASEELCETLFDRCEADAVICSAYLVEKFQNVAKKCKKLKTIITIDKKVDGVISLEEVMQKGKELAPKQVYHNTKIDLDKPAKILFTSGTTGANKPVILSQRNLAANMINCLSTVAGVDNEKNTSMSVLPMHHATEINTHIMCRIACGRLTYINGSMKDMMKNIKIFKPYVITVVPMIANAFYKQIWLNAKKLGKEKMLKKGIKLSNFLRKFGIDITHKLFKDIYAPFGGNLNQIVCGGAMLNPEVVKGLNDLGITIFNGYGITECGPLVSMNNETLKEPNSVGKPCKHILPKLADIDEQGVGELCIKGESVSNGYYKNPEDTKQVFDKEGFFHTGDLAKMDKKGRIFLVGRKKNVIVLDNGKNVCPEEVEHEVEITLDYVKDVVVYAIDHEVNGENKQIICAGVYIEDAAIRENKEKLQNDFRELNKKLPVYKRINFLNIVDSEYEKTSTKKIKRTAAIDRHNFKNGINL